MESQRKKQDHRVENLPSLVAGGFTGPGGCQAPVKIVKVSFAGLACENEGAGLQQMADFYLGGAERERFSLFRFEKRKREWLAGRIAAKCASLQFVHNAEKTLWEAEQWQQMQLAAGQDGKPYLVPLAAAGRQILPSISISHSHGLAVAMAARHPCGIDIQWVTAAIERVAERFVAADEHETLAPVAAVHGRLMALTLLWAAKEAVKKAAACGQVPDFLDIRLTARQRIDDGFRFAINVTEKGDHVARQQLVWLQLLGDFALAMTINSNQLQPGS